MVEFFTDEFMKKIYLYIKNIVKNYWFRYKPNTSYSQCGEDVVMNHLINWLGLSEITYLDIGTNDPKKFNNTYFFYRKSNYGVLVEPSPELCKKIIKARPNDVCINAGVGISVDKEMKYYQMIPNTLSTTCADKADEYVSMGVKLEKVISVPLVNINDLIFENFGGPPVILSVDVEGLDAEIIKSIDLTKYRPTIVCAETITYSNANQEIKLDEITDYLKSNEYLVYADTYINTIFVDRRIWDARPR